MTKEALLNRTLEDLGKQYPVGLYEYIFKCRCDLYGQLVDLENRVDRIYLDPNADIDQLKAVLRDYWKLHITAIKEFTNIGQLAFNLSVARQEMQEERIRA
jgi:hypothetical protein